MSMTVLDMVQDILNDMDSDEVNSITDTLESIQVAQIIKTTYFEILSHGEWPHLRDLLRLSFIGSATQPTHFKIPDDVQELEWIKYNTKKLSDTKDRYTDIDFLDPSDFMTLLNQRNSSDANIVQVQENNVTLLILNNKAPQYWTSFDDSTIIFDSFDSDLGATMLAASTQAYATREPVFTIADTFTPDLPSKVFPFLLSEAKSVAFNALKGPNAKEEQRARRQKARLSHDRWRTAGSITFPHYGRKK